MTITNITERERELSARVDELEAELEKARLHIKHIGNDALRAENAELRAELAAVRNQQPIGAVGDMGRDRAIIWYDYHTKLPVGTLVYLDAGAQPAQQEPEGPLVDGWQITLSDGHAGYGVYAHMMEYPDEGAIFLLSAGAQPVPESKTIATAPECLNTNDKAFWATGWNECRKAMLAAAKEPKCQ